jgi:thiol-disulfide isomerase/thioredoxin
VADTDKIVLTDEAGATATIGKAEVTLQDGLPLLTFHVGRRAPQSVQRLTGQIVDEGGAPVEAVRVGLVTGSDTGSGDTRIFATTDERGRFELDAPIQDSKQKHWVNLVVTKEGYASFDSRHFDIPQKASDAIDCGKLTLPPACSVPVRTVDENDQPLAGAVVEPMGSYAQRRQAIRTDEQGLGVLHNLPAGVIRLHAMFGPLTNQSQIVVDPQSAEGEVVTLRLRELKPPATQAQPMPEPPPIGAAAPELSIVEWTDGQAHTLGDYHGKVVVLDFWGIWCSACLNGLPARKELETKYAGRTDIVFLGIHSAGTDMSQVKKLQQLKNWTLITGLDKGDDVASGTTARAYGARGWPTTVIIDREGKVAYNSNLEKWDALTAFREQTQIAKALNLPPLKPDASLEDQIARTNAVNVYRLSELIDGVLEKK